MSTKSNPPKLAQKILRWFCSEKVLEFLQGDLEELYHLRLERNGRLKAALHYFLDVFSAVRPFAFKQSRSNSNIAMLKNFYFTSIRNFARNKRYFLTNLTGLTIGLTSFVLIAFYIINELSYDRFHTNHQQLYRASTVANINGKINREAPTSAPLAKVMLEEYPEIKNAVRVVKNDPILVDQAGRKFIEDGLLYADASFFTVFDFQLIEGSTKESLKEARSVVFTESYVKKYFGSEDPIGKQLNLGADSTFYVITGVVADPPANSHIQFDMLVSLSSLPNVYDGNNWIGSNAHTYLLLHDEVSVPELEVKMQDIFYNYMAPQIEYYTGQSIGEWEASGNQVKYNLFPFKDIHLKSDFGKELVPPGNLSYIYIYGVIGLIILCIAIFNYVNMATAQSATRAREVGIRKVMGSSWSLLVKQFIFESVILALFAGFLTAFLAYMFKPSFELILQKELAFGILSSPWVLLTLLVLSIGVGILAGVYPAFVLSRFHPVMAMKATLSPAGTSGWLRNGLVVIQFTASIVIIIVTLVVYHQIDYMLTKNLGFDKEQVLVIQRPDALHDHLEVFEDELKTNANVRQVVHSLTLPGKGYSIRSYRPVDRDETFLFPNNQISFHYDEVMDLELVAGRFFSKEHKADSNAVVINESAVEALGYENPIGQKLTSPWHRGEYLTIIGVMKDYYIESLHQPIVPVSLELMPDRSSKYITVKLNGGSDVRKTLEFIENKWTGYTNDHPFQYFFYDEEYEKLYQNETATGKVFAVLASLSILIACLGLVGLISFNISTRRKEVGIRKVLGASVHTLVWLLSNNMVRTALIASMLSWPISYFAIDYWLQNFAERTTINPWSFILATGVVLVIGGLAISFQTIRASLMNPVESLRQE
ncbi:putative ABC transport system permease protein [Ekhidna lutea]|uniref:Putative ABC transport system permease protein n=1 Tax=Ekhidna lutea TaxID=447679 RepID=A0A239GPK9_EKHLU|nr:ABC transporter permease [Ekhidna lutea]SNS70752.1 putative ABC transport system permease protein [Ekhidna lutea]